MVDDIESDLFFLAIHLCKVPRYLVNSGVQHLEDSTKQAAWIFKDFLPLCVACQSIEFLPEAELPSAYDQRHFRPCSSLGWRLRSQAVGRTDPGEVRLVEVFAISPVVIDDVLCAVDLFDWHVFTEEMKP